MASPLEQFEVKPIVPIDIGGVDISFTNSSLFMALTLGLSAGFLLYAGGRGAMVPGRLQMVSELIYEFIGSIIRETIGQEGRRYFPIIFTLFMFVLVGNMLGMVPYSFTFTSHIIVTFAMASIVFIGVTILALVKHRLHFFTFFVPPGAPVLMWPLLVPIEILSYLSRPISLSVRLFKVIAGFVVVLGVAGVIPLVIVVALTGLEILIAFLQAYVFTILTCLYIKDALELH